MRSKTTPDQQASWLLGRKCKHGPAWRYVMASQEPHLMEPVDPLLYMVHRFLKRKSSAFSATSPQDTWQRHMAGAVELEADPVLTGRVKLMVLGRFEPEEI